MAVVVTIFAPPTVPLVATKVVKVPAAAVVPPMGVLSIVLLVMAKAWRADDAISAVPVELTMATL